MTNPCQGICKQHNGYCSGCYRTPIEIRLWNKFDEAKKKQVIENCETRKLLQGELK